MRIVYQDPHICVVIKPARVLSTDEPGGVPELVRQELGDPKADVRTVHRLDRVVSGLMVLARNAQAASELSRQIREDQFEKEYLAVVHGAPESDSGRFCNLLLRDKARRMTFVTGEMAKGVQPAALKYQVLNRNNGMSRVRIQLETGRTHQIRVQFSSRDLPLVGERKYSTLEDPCAIALWSYRLASTHPVTKKAVDVMLPPPIQYPWDLFRAEELQ